MYKKIYFYAFKFNQIKILINNKLINKIKNNKKK